MEPQNKLCARKATWLAFGLIALAASISSAQDTTPQGSYSETTHVSALEAQQTVFFNARSIFVFQAISADATTSSLLSTPSLDTTAIVTKPPTVS